MNSFYTNNGAEEYFQNLADNRDALASCYQHICNTLNQALFFQDYDMLLSLVSYIESGEGHLAYEHIGETRRILRILNVIAFECKYLGNTFATDCTCMEGLMNKYSLILFSFRRLLFQLSEISVDEAEQYLQSNIISYFVAYVIVSEEMGTVAPQLWKKLEEVYNKYWTTTDMKLFRTLILQTD